MIALPAHLVRLGARPTTREEAIRAVAALLADGGCVGPGYEESMLAREREATTFLGNGIAIPHGTPAGRGLVARTGIAVLQVPEGVDWGGGEAARLVVGIAAKGDEHLDVLRRLTRVLGDPARVDALARTHDVDEIVAALGGEPGGHPVATHAPDLPFAEEVALPNPLGMHARPATFLAGLVRGRGGTVRLRRGADVADATRLMEVLGLGLRRGARFTVSAESAETLRVVRDAVAAGLGDDLAAPVEAEKPAGPAFTPREVGATLEGVGASGGLAVGVTRRHVPRALAVPDTPGEPAAEARRLDAAWGAARRELDALHDDAKARLGKEKAAIFRAHQALLADPALQRDTVAGVLDGHGAAWAWKAAADARVDALRKLDDPTLAARAVDLVDVRDRVLRLLLGTVEAAPPTPEAPVVLLARDLTPSDTAQLDTDVVLGVCTALGGPTSHTAILARGLGLPAVVAAGPGVLEVPDGTRCILDGAAGRLYLDPSAGDREAAVAIQAAMAAEREAARAARHQPAATRDGHPIEVAANINRAADAAAALDAGAEGVGLMRTEFLFMDRDAAPTEDEQAAEYAAMAAALGARPLVIRTLDIGGDKEVPYLGLAREDNSFLGIRGIRLCFERPDLFLPQLRAIFRAVREHGNVRVMFPMVATVEEFRRAKGLVEAVRAEVDAPEAPLGVMIEVPSAALMADEIAREVDFFSVGTNDLTQYTLAMDRLHPQLARQADALHPAVLRLIERTVRAADAHGKWVGVCGGVAGDELGALVLAGIGVHELSVSTPQIAAVKAALREHTRDELRDLARRALACGNAAEVRALRRRA